MGKKQDRWPQLCKLVEQPDGLPTRPAGAWTEDKLWFWNRYIDITTSSMVGNPKWPQGLVYVDLFAGPGICEIKSSRRRFPGSPLIAAHAPKSFRSILVCDADAGLANALEKRLRESPAASTYTVFRGDCNELIDAIVSKVPQGALTLCFVDPEGLHIRFDTLASLTKVGQVDLLILFADNMDIVRNVELYSGQNLSKLDQMLGPGSTWRTKWASLDNRTPENICRLFADEYKHQLRTLLGYKVFGEKQMKKSPNAPLYRLIFASKHPKGLEFWDKVTKRERGGQTSFDF